MNTKLKSAVFLLILTVLPSLAATGPSVSLIDQYFRIKDEDDLEPFLRELSKQQIFELCNQYGAAVDCGKEGKEGILIGDALDAVKRKEGLSSAELRNCACVATNSLHWRNFALWYSSGAEGFIDEQHIDAEVALRCYSGLFTNSAVPVVLRHAACVASAHVLVSQYYIAVCGSTSIDKARRVRVRTADTVACQAQDRNAAVFIDLALTLAEDKATSEMLKDEGIPKALRMIIRERGAKTPKLDQIQKLAEREGPGDVLPKQPYKNLLREVKTVMTGESTR